MAAIPSSELVPGLFLTFISIVWVRRAVWMMRFRKKNPPLVHLHELPASQPKISVIIPARNEEKNIANCLTHILDQSYPNYEVIVIDDRSTDRTSEILKELKTSSAAGDAEGESSSARSSNASYERARKSPAGGRTRGTAENLLRIVRIEKLPPGWTGKNYAMFAGSRVASGEWLLFTDADTTHRAESLNSAIACALDRQLDFLTLAPETESRSFWEKTVQPLASGSLAIWFDPDKINDPKNPFTLANGQFILVKKEIYERVGGNEAVKGEVVEDVELAKKIRSFGYRTEFLNGIYLYSTRMYDSLFEIKKGWTRIFTHLFRKNLPLIFHKIFLFLFFSLLPYFVLATELSLKISGSPYFSRSVFILSLGLCSLISLIRFVGNKMVRSNPWYGLLHPLGSIVMVWILLACVGRIVFKKPSEWKGSLYN